MLLKVKTENPNKSTSALLNQSFFAPKSNSKPIFFQQKLKVGTVDDVYEREADAIADKVMHMENSSSGLLPV